MPSANNNYSHLDDDKKLKRKFSNKRVNAEKEGLEFNLTFDQFCGLIEQANITSSSLGIRGYHLSRHNDSGNYDAGNCEFVPYLENLHSRKLSQKSIDASQANMQKMITASRTQDAVVARMAGLEEFWDGLRETKEAKRIEYLKTANPKQTLGNNSQYGSFWITDGAKNMKWRDSLGETPKGFYRGRK